MNNYERLLARVKALNIDLQQCASGAWCDRMDSVSQSTRDNYEGQSDGFGQAKERVEKILEDFPVDDDDARQRVSDAVCEHCLERVLEALQ